MKSNLRFWSLLFLIWFLSTCIDRLWWINQTGLPSWDQADYLNSALDHGRALGILPGGEWQGFKALLDLSPKIPPLASIVNGSVIALAGDEPAQAAWSLSLWHGLLLIGVAGWGMQLRGEVLGLISAFFVAVAPALLQLRSDYVLEMPLTAVITISLWQLGTWLAPETGGKWRQCIAAGIACASALLIKQSALLILLPAIGWAAFQAVRKKQVIRYQLLTISGLILSGILPWLRHNWITAISGTQRAVFESAIIEGDPSLLTVTNWLWYPRLIPSQINPVILWVGLSGCILWVLMHYHINTNSNHNNDSLDKPKDWQWLIITLISGWIFTTLSPNKDDRYITPLLSPLLLLIARGWLQWRLWAQKVWPNSSKLQIILGIITGLGGSLPTSWQSQTTLLSQGHKGPLQQIINTVEQTNPHKAKQTIIVVPSTPDLNQHNVSYFGRKNGGQLVGRQLGNGKGDTKYVLQYAQWVLLAEGDQGSVSKFAAILDKNVRDSGVFVELKRFSRPNGDSYSLWKRQTVIEQHKNFSKRFPSLATGLGNGPQGLEKVFSEIAIEHMLDGHFLYRDPVRISALAKLKKNPANIEARWTMALLAILANRPNEAEQEFAVLEELLPTNPWPSSYRTIMHLAALNPWKAAYVANQAKKTSADPVLHGLSDLSDVLAGLIWKIPPASKSIPSAIQAVEKSLNQPNDIDFSDQGSN